MNRARKDNDFEGIRSGPGELHSPPQFRDVFTDLINSSEPTHPIISHHAAPKDGIVVDMYSAASRVTYDIIGQVAIDHTFDTLGQPHGEGGELFEKYEKMQQMVPGSGGYRQEIGVVLPWIDKIAVSSPRGYSYTKRSD